MRAGIPNADTPDTTHMPARALSEGSNMNADLRAAALTGLSARSRVRSNKHRSRACVSVFYSNPSRCLNPLERKAFFLLFVHTVEMEIAIECEMPSRHCIIMRARVNFSASLLGSTLKLLPLSPLPPREARALGKLYTNKYARDEFSTNTQYSTHTSPRANIATVSFFCVGSSVYIQVRQR